MNDSSCPGCGLVLPATGSAIDTRSFRATAECLDLHGEVTSNVMQHPEVLGRWHQTCVDSYAAQHVGPQMRPMTVCFALNGLYLVLERGWSGIAARDAHGHLARTVVRADWPNFEPPSEAGPLTVLDGALSADLDAQGAAIEAWGRSVWATWSHVHDAVRQLTDRQLAGWVPHSP
jgi:hypothetical protein